MPGNLICIIFAAGALILGAPAYGQGQAAKKAPVKVTSVEGITEYRLDNGLRVLIYPDPSKPTVTVNLTIFVGSRHEGYGETGMAHLLEHMLFKGTPTHKDPWKLLQEHGARFNGTTSWDRTNYFEELPASPENLEFAIRLEADRMVNSRVDPEDLAKEFSVVRNEFEMGENSPANVLEEKMYSVAFQWHNYGKTTIGSRSDIERVPIDNLRAFYRKHYQPDNALFLVAGKFDEKRALALIQDTFGRIPRPARRLAPTWTQEPVQDGERTVTLRRTGDVAVVALMYHGHAGPHPEWAAEDAILDILTTKPTGRLYKALVEKGLASEVYGQVYPTAEPGVMFMGAKVRAGGAPDKVREIMVKTVEGLAAGKIRTEEVERWRTRSMKEIDLALTQTGLIGVVLSDYAAMGDWRLFFLTRDRIKALTVADVERVARKFLKESNRTVGTFIPTKEPDRAPLPEVPDVAAMIKDYQGAQAASDGESFIATVDTIEKRTSRITGPAGMKIALLPKKTRGGAVRLLLNLRFGDEKTLQGKVQAAGLIPQMLLRGTRKHTFQQLKDELDRLKAEVSFGGGRGPGTPGVATVKVLTVRESLPQVISLLGEVLREPIFPRAEFEILRKEILAQLEEQLQDPMANAFTALFQKVYPFPRADVRHVPSIKESIEDLRAMNPADLAKLHKELWGISHAQLAIVGDFAEAEVRAALDRALGGWKSPRPYERVARPYQETAASSEEILTPDKQNAMVGVGQALALRDEDPEYPALTLLNFMLGGSASSRLMNRLRQKEGLSYGAFSGLSGHPIDRSGMLYAGAICAPQNADKALSGIIEEVARIRSEAVGEAELNDAKRSYAQSFSVRIADDDFVAADLAQGLFIGRTFEYWRKLNERIQNLSPEDIAAAARKHIQPEKLARIKAGDLKAQSKQP